LIQAAQAGHKDVLEYLTSQGVAVHAATNADIAALFLAAQNGHKDCSGCGTP